MYEESGKKILSGNVDVEVRELIGDFSILWNLYERIKLNYAEKRYREVHGVSNRDTVYQEQIHEELLEELRLNSFMTKENEKEIDINFESLKLYLRKNSKEYRDFNASNVINYFHVLKWNENAKKEVTDLFDNNSYRQTWNPWDKLHLLLIVIYRVRNNMFHGSKIVTKLNDEEGLFIIGNNIMTMLLDPLQENLEKLEMGEFN